MLYIGARSAFLFIGSEAEWRERMQAVNDRVVEKMQRVLQTRMKRYIRELNRPDRDEKTVAQLADLVRKAQEDIENFKPLWDREIRDTYPCEDGTVVLLEGSEEGFEWVRDEEAEPTKNKPIKENAELLAEAIVIQAAADYASMVKHNGLEGDESIERLSVEKFFRSRYYGNLTAIDGELLMKWVAADPDAVLKRKHFVGYNFD